jgi:hypothetical protein
MLEEFDFNFLWNMVDHGFEVSKYPYESKLEDDRMTVKFGEHYFSFEITGALNNEVEWGKLAAKRAAFRMRDVLTGWNRADEHKHILDLMDEKYGA